MKKYSVTTQFCSKSEHVRLTRMCRALSLGKKCGLTTNPQHPNEVVLRGTKLAFIRYYTADAWIDWINDIKHVIKFK